jgi:branched-chain amino acid transport system substrate-binding protein
MKLKQFSFAVFAGLALYAGSSLTAYAQTLKLGVIAPLTGAGAPWGVAAAEAAKIIAADFNQKGGLEVGGRKYQVQIIAYDDQFKATDAVAAYNRLINHDEAKYILIHTSAASVALKQRVEDDKVVALSGGYTPKSIDANTKFMFRVYSTPTDYLPSLVKWLGQNMTGKRIAILNPNDETGWDQSQITNKLFKENGFDVASNDLYERTQQDFQAVFTRVNASKPDVVDLGTSSPTTAAIMIRQARELGYQGQIVKTGGPGWQEIVAGAGKEAAEGTIGILYANPNNENYRRISAEYKKSIGQDPNDMLLPIYDGFNVLLHAIQKAGAVDDTTKVAAAFAQALPMKSIQSEELTLGGKANWGSNQQIMTVNYIGIIKSGVPQVVGSVK